MVSKLFPLGWMNTDGVSPSLTPCKSWAPRWKTNRSFESGGRGTFMMKKRRMMMTTLTCGWIHTADWPRLSGSPMCFTHVLLSNRVLMASRGINCEKRKQKGVVLQGCLVLPLCRELIPSLTFQGSFCSFLRDRFYSWLKGHKLRSPRNICAASPSPRGPVLA